MKPIKPIEHEQEDVCGFETFRAPGLKITDVFTRFYKRIYITRFNVGKKRIIFLCFEKTRFHTSSYLLIS